MRCIKQTVVTSTCFYTHKKPTHIWGIYRLLYQNRAFKFLCRMLYWADRGDTAKIECSWLDGQERKVLVADGLGWPTGLSIDFTNGDRIYWSDSKENRIESILPSGEQRRTAVYIGED